VVAKASVFVMQMIVNGQPREVADGATVAALLDELNLSGKPVAVEVNLDLVPRQRHAEHRLAEGDRVEIVTLVGGG
jgi:sulfur carrier protein